MSDDNDLTRHDHVLMGLVFSLQAGAMQQLGKLQDPQTGDVTLDLEQARATIDILEMLKNKCRTGTPAELVRLIDQTVLNLQLNYMDELKKSAPAPAPAPDTEATDATDATAAADPDAPAGGEGTSA